MVSGSNFASPDITGPPVVDERSKTVAEPLLRMTQISKAYESIVALSDVSLEVAAGSVHGLVGENGAGKSTLMKVLAGLVQPDHGAIQLDGRGQLGRSGRRDVGRNLYGDPRTGPAVESDHR